NDLPKIFSGQCNIGVKLGEDSKRLIDFDLDCDEAVRIAEKVLTKTMTFGRKSKPRSHWLYYAAGSDVLKTHEEKQYVELRADSRHQTVFPGSTHKDTGELIEWTGDARMPVSVSWEEAVADFHMIAATSMLAKEWQEGKRDDMFLALAGGLGNAKGW